MISFLKSKNLFLIILFFTLILISGCGSFQVDLKGGTEWSNWQESTKVNYGTVAYSEDGSKIYFSRGFTIYNYRSKGGSFWFNEGEYELKYRKASLYELELATRKIREIKEILPAEKGAGKINKIPSDINSIYPEVYAKVAIRGKNIFYLSSVSINTLSKCNLNGNQTTIILSAFNNFDLDKNGEAVACSTLREIFIKNLANQEQTKILSEESFSQNIAKGKYMTIEDLKWSDDKTKIVFQVRWPGTMDTKQAIEVWSVNILTTALEKMDGTFEAHSENISPDKSSYIYQKSSDLCKAPYAGSIAGEESLTTGIPNESWGIIY